MKKLPTLQLQPDGTVHLPNGSTVLAAYAAWHGFAVEEPKPVSKVIGPAERDAAYSAVLSLPEAEGRFAAARHLAATGTAPSLAARILVGLPGVT
ncbi:MAG: hypothetical protein ACRYGP_17445 [Janthinobacterium lividum]